VQKYHFFKKWYFFNAFKKRVHPNKPKILFKNSIFEIKEIPFFEKMVLINFPFPN